MPANTNPNLPPSARLIPKLEELLETVIDDREDPSPYADTLIACGLALHYHRNLAAAGAVNREDRMCFLEAKSKALHVLANIDQQELTGPKH